MKTSLLSLSTRRSSKTKSPRSVFLSSLLTALGGDTGDAVAGAFVQQDIEKFKALMTAVVYRW